jgi:hypothetical protein
MQHVVGRPLSVGKAAQKSCDKIILRTNGSEAAMKPWPTLK